MPSRDGEQDGDKQRATREYPTRDLPPEAWAGTAEEWSDLDDEGRRIGVFSILPASDRDPSILVPTGNGSTGGRDYYPDAGDGDESDGKDPDPRPRRTTDGVTAAECGEIRDRMNDALTAREVVEDYPDLHTSKVMRHAYGECNHSEDAVDAPPTASPQIGPDECHAMRDDYRQGNAVSTVAKEWARSENTVTRHIFGRCSHDSRPRDTSPSRVRVRECERLRRTFEGNEKVGVREVACAMRLRKEVAATHLFDYCRHYGNDPPEEDPPDPGEADLWDGRNA
jgi:hypothetical protein